MANPTRVVVRPFHLPWQGNGDEPSRTERLIDRVLLLDEAAVRAELDFVYNDFGERHWQTRTVFLDRFDDLAHGLAAQDDDRLVGATDAQRELIGAYFCHEYSYTAAALMNPSIVPHPDQSGMTGTARRFILSLRAVGEGHISSIAFREGILEPGRTMNLLAEPPVATSATRHWDSNDLDDDGSNDHGDGGITIYRHSDSSLSGTVIFPMTQAQRNGLEDLRLTPFVHDDGSMEWLGTYTAYDGSRIQSEMLRTRDFRSFRLVPMRGSAARNKGMALFPRKIGGRYMMIARQDGENLFIIGSDDILHWDEGRKLLEPRFAWEFVQIGNCGAPIETEHGWLLLTHGVGAMRKYSIGAILLDRDDPSRVLARTARPILSPAYEDRNGYVPNVVYTCGAMLLEDDLFIPYGIADSAVGFAYMKLDALIAAMG